MVLEVKNFRIHPSLKKTIRKFACAANSEIRIDTAFEEVIRACSTSSRAGQNGTWILPDMVQAYTRLHHAGVAHSVETWIDGELVGGLYGVGIGHAVFGESMFHLITDASKIALAALVALCRQHKISQIDCQQNTRHLASLGAREVSRAVFVNRVRTLTQMPSFSWKFAPVYWDNLAEVNDHTTDGS
jgi:leucyl/phenylalanyl-tRNA--protein transferase